MNGFKVSNTSYFVYCNGKTDRDSFNQQLEFDISLLPYEGNSDWVEEAVVKAFKLLNKDSIPQPSKDCDFCEYYLSISNCLKK